MTKVFKRLPINKGSLTSFKDLIMVIFGIKIKQIVKFKNRLNKRWESRVYTNEEYNHQHATIKEYIDYFV